MATISTDDLRNDLYSSLFAVLGWTFADAKPRVDAIVATITEPGDVVAALTATRAEFGNRVYGGLLKFHDEIITSVTPYARALATPEALAHLGMTVEDMDWHDESVAAAPTPEPADAEHAELIASLALGYDVEKTLGYEKPSDAEIQWLAHWLRGEGWTKKQS